MHSSTGEDLQKWAQTMGFTPEGHFPSAETFQKLCRGKTTKLWVDVMNNVKPKEEILHIQKNLLLKRLREGKPLEQKPVSGHLCQQIINESKILARQNLKKKLLASIQQRETSIQNQEKALRKSGHKVIDLEQQIDEYKKKQILFKLKVNKCRSTLHVFKQINQIAVDLCPPVPDAKPPGATTSESCVVTLTECINALGTFYSRNYNDDLVVGESERDAHSKQLWEFIRSNTTGWGAQQLWDTINSDLMAALLDEVSTSAASGNLLGDELKRSSDKSRILIENSQTILPAILMTSILENINLETKIKIKAGELQNLQAKCRAKIDAFLSSENVSSLKTVSADGFVKMWVEAYSKEAELRATLQSMKNDLVHLKKNIPSYINASSQLKTSKEELTNLNSLIDHEKRQVEENITLMNMVAHRLQSAQTKVLEQRAVFNSSCSSNPLVKRWMDGQSPENTHLVRNAESYQNRFFSDGDSFSSGRKVPLSSTMIGNMTADSTLFFDTTASECDMLTEKVNAHLYLPEIVSVLKDSISKEAKLFIKLSLKTLPSIHVNGSRISECYSMVKGPLMLPHSVNNSKGSMLQGTPVCSATQIMFDQMRALDHIRALSIYKLLHVNQPPVLLDAPKTLASIKYLLPNHEEELQGQVVEVGAALDDIKLLLCNSKINMEMWLERPIQKAIPSCETVGGRSFVEWCKLYDSIVQDKKN